MPSPTLESRIDLSWSRSVLLYQVRVLSWSSCLTFGLPRLSSLVVLRERPGGASRICKTDPTSLRRCGHQPVSEGNEQPAMRRRLTRLDFRLLQRMPSRNCEEGFLRSLPYGGLGSHLQAQLVSFGTLRSFPTRLTPSPSKQRTDRLVSFFAASVNILHLHLDIPVTAKFRVFDTTEKTVEYALMLERAGAQILTCHGRTRDMKGHNTVS
jgi:hypothetical protein